MSYQRLRSYFLTKTSGLCLGLSSRDLLLRFPNLDRACSASSRLPSLFWGDVPAPTARLWLVRAEDPEIMQTQSNGYFFLNIDYSTKVIEITECGSALAR